MELVEAKRKIDEALERGRFAVVVGNCRVKYEGRAASKLSEGDRVLVIKNDGTFLVHQTQGMAAINYQGPGASISASMETAADGDSALVLSAFRSKKSGVKESIVVRFASVQACESWALKDDRKLQLFGSERQLSDLLMQDLNLIEPGLRPLQQESAIRKGTIDILAEDREGRLVVIEVKRREAGLDAVSQLSRYVSELAKRKEKKVRGVLCAPRMTPTAHAMLERDGLEFFKLDYVIGNPSAKIRGLQKKQQTIGAFSD